MIGEKFGKWTVLHQVEDKLGREFWHCKSDIGTEADISIDIISSGALEKESPNKTRRFKDITGKQNGKLTVLAFDSYTSDGKVKWLCQCKCGNIKVVRAASFNNGTSSSCGCSRNKPTKDCADIVGKKFGRWTVLGRDFTKPRTNIYLYCVCECTPDKVHSVNYNSLKRGLSKSCGCYNSEHQRELHIKDLVGQRFDRLEVVSFLGVENNHSMWECLCDCGNTCVKSSVTLTNGFLSSCGKCPRTILTGRTFGDLYVVSYAYSDNGKHYWHCKCSCGNPNDLLYESRVLIDGARKSCGHRTRFNLIGQVFDRLTVIATSPSKNGDRFWECECSCDKHTKVIVSSTDLRSGKVKSCGCKFDDYNKEMRDAHIGELYNTILITEFDHRKGSSAYYKTICIKCGRERVINLYPLMYGIVTHCPCESVASRGSKAELEIRDYVMSIVDYIPTKEKILNNKEIDLYYKDLLLGIEYNGSVYHASNNVVYADESPKPINYHRDKFLCAKEKGIHLITIFDVDWQNNQDRIKLFLHDVFSDDIIHISVEHCFVKHILFGTAFNFADVNDVHGAKFISDINYGLYYKDMLLAVMSFKDDGDDCFTMTCCCMKNDYVVDRGYMLLLYAFEKDYFVSNIVAYSDNDYVTGDEYVDMGFSYICQLDQDYYWFLGGEELDMVDISIEHLSNKYPDLYEEAVDNHAKDIVDYILTELNAYKVYRSGVTKWGIQYSSLT